MRASGIHSAQDLAVSAFVSTSSAGPRWPPAARQRHCSPGARPARTAPHPSVTAQAPPVDLRVTTRSQRSQRRRSGCLSPPTLEFSLAPLNLTPYGAASGSQSPLSSARIQCYRGSAPASAGYVSAGRGRRLQPGRLCLAWAHLSRFWCCRVTGLPPTSDR